MRRCRTRQTRRVTPHFIRSIRKAYLGQDGIPAPGYETKAEVLLKAHHAVVRGDYKWAMAYAKRGGMDLEAMYRDYSRVLVEAGRGVSELLEGFGRFCRKNNLGIKAN